MSEKGIERRLCQRFKIPGATVSFRRERLLFPPKQADEEFCPVLDLSRGGVRFLAQKALKFRARVSLQISVPGERVSLQLRGRVRWSSYNPGKSYKFQMGVQFNPYGEGKDQNYPGALVKIIALEQKFIEAEDLDESKKSEFQV